MAQKKHLAANQLAGVVCLAFCACSFGQTVPPPRRQPVETTTQRQPTNPAPVAPSAPVPTPSPATAPSLLDHPPQPATVSLASGKLTVQANNSSLSDILNQVATAGGMKLEGLQTSANSDQRVFGSYGPGAPRDVLSELLNGSGYNVIMLGETPSGAPRELTLTARNSAGTASAPTQSPSAVRNGDDQDQDEVQPTRYTDEQQNLTPPPGPPEMRNGVRTPQQMLQELQKMRDQQQQQQQPDQQPN